VSDTPNTCSPYERTLSKISIECGASSIELEIGRMALQATETVCVRSGDSEVISPLVVMPEAAPDADFLPLSVHYHKRNYADGHIPGNHGRREGRPNDAEMLVSRLIDRLLRATFPKGFYHEVQITPLVISSDPNISSDILAMMGASAALALSGLPCRGPVAGVRVGYVNEKFIVNPTQAEMGKSALDLVIAGTETEILMVEAEANALKKEIIIDAILFGHAQVKSIVQAIGQFASKIGKPKWKWASVTTDLQWEQKMRACFQEEELQAIHQVKGKRARKEKRDALRRRVVSALLNESSEIKANQLEALFNTMESNYVKARMLSTKKRMDGREPHEIRHIQIETNCLARVHGSVLFTRGETQALVTATLGSDRDAQLVDGLDGVTRRDTFLFHYNFPPYCVGEVGQMSSPKRREIGHANLAKRAMRAVLPNERECPYVLRVVSDIMGADGSSSMATVCGASLALMDAGIALKSHVAGIAMGLVKDGDHFIVLSDISEDEDHTGDMDLKVAGTREGITAIQMDIKTDGITRDVLLAAITQAQEGINTIIDQMESVMAGPRQKVSPYAPQVMDMTIPIDKIQVLIGKGGATIRAITEETGTLIDIHRETGLIRISATDAAACEQAIQRIKLVTEDGEEVVIGDVYEGAVIKLMKAGATVSLLPGRRGFVHISEMVLEHPSQAVHEVLKEKQRIMVKVLDIDRQKNRISLTMKGIVTEESQAETPV
jgi:polyribonucleotide nucleotidyltransferase